jgi:hypothetical protein
MASQLVLAKGISTDEATAWRRSNTLRIQSPQADVDVEAARTEPVAALLLPPALLGRSAAATRKPGYGHRWRQ